MSIVRAVRAGLSLMAPVRAHAEVFSTLEDGVRSLVAKAAPLVDAAELMAGVEALRRMAIAGRAEA